LGSQIRQGPFFVRQSRPKGLQEFLSRDALARSLLRGRHVHLLDSGGHQAIHITPLAMRLSNLKRQLVASNRHEQFDKLLGPLEVVLARRDSDKKTSQDRLADVHRIEQAM
jgi:hypothetical protein